MRQKLNLHCPSCGRTWRLEEYAGVWAEGKYKAVLCSGCVAAAPGRWHGYVHGPAAELASRPPLFDPGEAA